MKTRALRCTHCIIVVLFGALPLLILAVFIKYSTSTLPVTITHAREFKAIGVNGLNASMDYHSKSTTSSAAHEKIKSLPNRGSASSVIEIIFSLPKKVLDWLTNKTPTSKVLIQVPFNQSYAEGYRYLIPRAAFLDNRVRGEHNNATVILSHGIRSKVKVVGCVTDGHFTEKIELKDVSINGWVHLMHPECTHDNFFIFCFDTPGRNNSKVSVMYENPKNRSEIFITDSEHFLFIPKSKEMSEHFNLSIMVCTTVYGSPLYIGEWLRYQKLIGVDFVYMNAVETFLDGDAYNDIFLQESIKNGFVQLKVWKEYLRPGALHYHAQSLYYQDCVYRFQGIYEYAIMADTDDFVILADGRDIRQIIQSQFDSDPKLGGVHSLGQLLRYPFHAKQKVGGIQLEWVRYFAPGGKFNYNDILAGNFSQNLRSVDEGNYKSIHKLSATSDVGIHTVSEQMLGYTWVHVPRDVIYMAHLRNR